MFVLFCVSIVNAEESPPIPYADSAALMDADTGYILYSKNMDNAYSPASTTKILTALITLKKCNLQDKVVIGKNPPSADGNRIGIVSGEELTVEQLLYGLILCSGNDCAIALAENVSGSQEKFVDLMNSTMVELGGKDSHFVNSNGLFDKDHKALAKDLALVLKELAKYQDYYKISKTLQYTIPATNKPSKARVIYNENKMILPSSGRLYYKEAVAGKTGYTIDSRFSYVAMAKKDSRTLIVTLIHDCDNPDFRIYSNAINLFNYGFNNFKNKKIISKGDDLRKYALDKNLTVPLIASSDYIYTVKNNSEELPSINIKLPLDLKLKNFKKDDTIGDLDISIDGNLIGTIKLLSGVDHIIETHEPLLF